MWSPDLVIYHHPCADGFGAAWAIHTVWPEAEYVPAKYGDAPPAVDGKRVLIVDFSYPYDVLVAMSFTAASIAILDHHKTAQADLARLPMFHGSIEALEQSYAFSYTQNTPPIAAHFDMGKSGARLAWEFAQPGKEVPNLIRLIEDRDLWRFDLPQSQAFATWLRTQPMTFGHWETIATRLQIYEEAQQIHTEAAAMQLSHDALVGRLAGAAVIVNIGGLWVPCVNCPGELASDVGNALLIKYPEARFSATYYDERPGVRKISLRSDNNRVDVSEIARSFGGGGHRNAAGFTETNGLARLQPMRVLE